MGISVFEIIGPIMVGPSSSHTAGMARIGMMAGRIIDEAPCAIHLELSPKMKPIYAGHKSDAALIGGTIGMKENDASIRDAIAIANAKGITTDVTMLPDERYPQNTARITVEDVDHAVWSVTGTSVGGGSIVISEVDLVPLTLNADAWHLVIWSQRELAAENVPQEAKYQKGVRADGIVVSVLSFIERPDDKVVETLRLNRSVRKISVVQPVLEYGVSRPEQMTITSLKEASREASREGISLAELAVRYEMARSGFSREDVVARMQLHLDQMKKSVEMGKKNNQMLFNLTGGRDGFKLRTQVESQSTISQGLIPKAVAMALGVMEYNGAMGCLVAAPTAGSSGIVPGAMITAQEAYGLSDEKVVEALFTAALIGVIMAERDVSFSGSVGGCQGEVGVSSAITAAGLAALFTDDSATILHAMAMCLKNLLGLVCDPIAGPIEVPCIKRNAVGVANAYISADMALAGIRSYVPPDEVIDALVDVEKRLPTELKCGSCAGLAGTRTAVALRARLAANQ